MLVIKSQNCQTGTRKATGGSISFYNGKTIHTFTGSGTFANTSGSPLSIEYVVLAGGGSGGGKIMVVAVVQVDLSHHHLVLLSQTIHMTITIGGGAKHGTPTGRWTSILK